MLHELCGTRLLMAKVNGYSTKGVRKTEKERESEIELLNLIVHLGIKYVKIAAADELCNFI